MVWVDLQLCIKGLKMTTKELNRMKKFDTPYVLDDTTIHFKLKCKGKVRIGKLILDLRSKVVAPITFVYKDGSFLSPTAFDVTSETGYGEHHFRLNECSIEWVYIKLLI